MERRNTGGRKGGRGPRGKDGERGPNGEDVDNVQQETGISFGNKPMFTSTKPKVNAPLDQPLQSQESAEYADHRKVTYTKED